jgi:pimeloyl-ACP methyl ester carboxylesterase
VQRVVLLHGIGVGADYLLPLADALPCDADVPELPGWRRSKGERRVLDLAQLGEALVPLLPAPIAANSMGCQVAVELAIRRPELVPSLVLIGPTVDPHLRPLWRTVRGFVRDAVHEPLPLWWIAARDYAAMGPVRFVKTARAAWEHRIEERLPLVQQPTLVLRGAHDGLASQRWCEEAAALVPNGRLRVLDGHAHAVHYTAPLLVAQEIEQHLGEG